MDARAARLLYNPVQLRVLLMLVTFGTWYAAGIDETARQTEREKKRLVLPVEVERLRAQVERFQARLPEKTDPNEWDPESTTPTDERYWVSFTSNPPKYDRCTVVVSTP